MPAAVSAALVGGAASATPAASEPEEPGGEAVSPLSTVTSASIDDEMTRRTSLEEDYFYREVMTISKRPTEPPPTYQSTIKKIRRQEKQEAAAAAARASRAAALAVASQSSPAKGKEKATPVVESDLDLENEDILPPYSCDINLESLFQRKMEIENATKRAQDRRWVPSIVVLRGTALEIYQSRKDRSWGGLVARGGPGVSPDNPPWLRKGELEKRYSLAFADVGIAADYVKRRYVIRVRAESDQFLLSCVELETFVRWLDALFAALSISPPIDERDFPRDQSIPRMQRVRWYNGRAHEREPAIEQQVEREPELDVGHSGVSGQTSRRLSGHDVPDELRRPVARLQRLASGQLSSSFGDRITASQTENSRSASGRKASVSSTSSAATITAPIAPLSPPNARAGTAGPSAGPSVVPVTTRLSTTTYHNEAIDAATGKWQPHHRWTKTHDMVYAKLCYATLGFRSPRKSNYIIMRGKQWYVDWRTGNMHRVLPPRYGEYEMPGPFYITQTENTRI